MPGPFAHGGGRNNAFKPVQANPFICIFFIENEELRARL